MSRNNDSINMKYGQIAGNRSINALIYRCFKCISENDQHKFVKKFRDEPHDCDQVMHTFRELILGAYLSSSRFRVRYDYAIDTKTPDWSILDKRLAVAGIVELTNFHIDRTTEMEIEHQKQAGRVAAYRRDENKDNVSRLYDCILGKAQAYRALVEARRVPYVVAVFSDLRAAVDFKEDLCPCLFDEKMGLFKKYPGLSGVLYFEENAGRYSFRYEQNPDALRVIHLPDGTFPSLSA